MLVAFCACLACFANAPGRKARNC